MNSTFVHTPMAAITVPERELFWHNFDTQYHAAHPGLGHMVIARSGCRCVEVGLETGQSGES